MNPAQEYRKIILTKLPPGTIVSEHSALGHFYRHKIWLKPEEDPYPSVTGKLQILKDPSIVNFRLNRNNDYIFQNWKKFTEANIMEHLDIASRVGEDIRDEAGSIGSTVHDVRQQYFEDWIAQNKRPEKSILEYIPQGVVDPRVTAAVRAIEKFLDESYYWPVVCEMFVADKEFKVGGTLDDVGVMHKVLRKGTEGCKHSLIDGKKYINCVKCEYKARWILVLMDLKTSNQFKDHYFFQVAMYFLMFKRLIGLKPKHFFILKTSKVDGTYKKEVIQDIQKLLKYAKNILKVDEGLDFVKSLRKDNQKVVAPTLSLRKEK